MQNRAPDVMEPTIFQFILRYSRPQQIFLTVMIVLYFPLQYLTLELPKIIVDDAIRAEGDPPYNVAFMGIDVTIELDQVTFLIALAFAYLGLVLLAGGVKYYVNVYRGRLGERMLRRLRYQLFERMLRFPLRHFRRTSQGEIIPMITAEVEPLGGFVGTAYSDPIFQGGQLLIILGFIMAQDWILGLAAITFYPLQVYILPRLQKKVNELAKRRVREVRKLSDHIGEAVSGIQEVHVHGTGDLERSRFSSRMSKIYDIRYEIYRRKFFIKFLNNFIDKLTPFFFFSIGGYLVIAGSLSVGSLLAIIAAYKEISSPWKELLTWYQQKEDVRIKYRQIIRQFAPEDMIDTDLTDGSDLDRIDRASLDPVQFSGIRLVEPDGSIILQDVSLTLPLKTHVAFVGDAHCGKTELGELLARIQNPTSGRVLLGEHDLGGLSEPFIGRVIGYVDRAPFFQTGTIGSNLLYGMKQRPVTKPDAEPSEKADSQYGKEALLTGNSQDLFNGEWVDYAALGLSDPKLLRRRINDVLETVELEQFVLNHGLRLRIGMPERSDEWMGTFLRARELVDSQLKTDEYQDLVEPFDPERYNENASVGENLIFGTILDPDLTRDDLARDPFVMELLDKTGITFDFLIIGKKLTETMIELFSDLPPGHEYFERFSFIRHRDLADYQAIAAKAERSFDELDEDERRKLVALPFQLVTARHRLGLINDQVKDLILQARKTFQAELPERLREKFAFFDSKTYNPGVSFQDNLLFGKVAYGQPHSASRVNALLNAVVTDLGLTDLLIEIGLNAPVGVAGSSLGSSERQKLGLARILLKDPEILIVNEAMAGLDRAAALRIMESVLRHRKDRNVIWFLTIPEGANRIDHVIEMRDGGILRQGPPQPLLTEEGNSDLPEFRQGGPEKE